MDHAGRSYDRDILKAVAEGKTYAEATRTIVISEGTGKSAAMSRADLLKELLPSLNKLFFPDEATAETPHDPHA